MLQYIYNPNLLGQLMVLSVFGTVLPETLSYFLKYFEINILG
jgi:hypothetical protein